jgi:hypothetical protein
MHPEHPRWSEFRARLNEVLRCRRTTEHARAILETMDGIDAGASLLALRELGGYCDCAILYDLCEDSHRALA